MSFGLLTGLGAALAWGTMDIASALASRRVGSLLVVAGSQVVSAILLIAVTLITGTVLPADPSVNLLAGALGIVGAGAYLAYFNGLRIGPISVVSGMVAAYGGLTVVLAVVLRGETLTTMQALGAAIATVGVILTGVAFDGSLRGIRLAGPGVIFAIVALVLFSVMTIGLATAIEQASWLGVILVSRIVNAVASLVAVLAMVARRHSGLRSVGGLGARRIWAVVAVAGLLDVLGLMSLSIGLESAPTWLVGLASSFGPAITILVAVAFMGERLKPIQWLGLIGVLVGMIAIGLP
jgi:drug/metabolite transporter (DMT)-like permease